MKFGRLTVLEFSHMKGKHSYWKCRCDCGVEKVIRSDTFTSKSDKPKTQSCGCLNRESKSKTHGESRTKLYHVWATMKNRCNDENNANYRHYGGRGIQVCNEWSQDYVVFRDWAVENGYSEGLTLDRINVNGNYEPLNCRWITQEEQNRNTRSTILIKYDGKEQCISEWARELHMSIDTLYARIRKNGWDIEKALTTPVNK